VPALAGVVAAAARRGRRDAERERERDGTKQAPGHDSSSVAEPAPGAAAADHVSCVPMEQVRPRRPLERATALVGLALFLVVALACKLGQKKAYGEECVDDEQCKVGTCSPTSKMCTHACTYDRECGKGHVCRFDGSAAGNSCAK